MPNTNLLTYASKVSSVQQVYYAPVAVLPSMTSVPIGTIYCFLSKVTPWDSGTPETPKQDQKSIKQIFKNMFVTKLVTAADISPVIERIDWTTGITYDYYRDNIDIFELNDDNTLVNKFYVKNKYDQVFKCLWNGNDTASTDEPYFQPGQYGTNNIYYGTDGYKWKYMYTIDAGSKVKFMDANWIPVPIGNNIPNPYATPGLGSIDVINVLDGGSGYDPSNAAIAVVITGDGTGATAQVGTVTNGKVDDIIVLNSGTGYTYANVSLSTTRGSGIQTISPASPIGGHAFDSVSELGSFNVMITCQFEGNELTQNIPIVPTTDGNGTPIEYYQSGLIISPISNSSYPNPASNTIYKTTTDFVVSSSPDSGFVSGETLYQGTNISTANFTATVLSFDSGNNVVHLINTYGQPVTNQVLKGSNSGSVRTLLSVSTPDFIIGSGYLSFVENLTGIQRSPDGIEQYKMVLSF